MPALPLLLLLLLPPLDFFDFFWLRASARAAARRCARFIAAGTVTVSVDAALAVASTESLPPDGFARRMYGSATASGEDDEPSDVPDGFRDALPAPAATSWTFSPLPLSTTPPRTVATTIA